jgi:hypothetical protein
VTTIGTGSGGPARLWSPERWFEDEAFAPIPEINELALRQARRRAQSAAAGGDALLRELRGLWCALDDAALVRVARCPYLLVDAGFADPMRWHFEGAPGVRDAERLHGVFCGEGASELARLVFTYSWHLARAHRHAARLAFGMSVECIELIAAFTPNQIMQIADRHPYWVGPRWPRRIGTWRMLLHAALDHDPRSLELAQLAGLRMLAGEAWRMLVLEAERTNFAD